MPFLLKVPSLTSKTSKPQLLGIETNGGLTPSIPK